MARDTTDPAIKAAALADLHTGEQPAVVAERYGLDRGLVKMWKQRYVTAGVTRSSAPVTVVHRPAVQAQQLAIGDLIQDNLRAKLIATQRIAEHVTTTEWLEKQSASDVATLFTAIDQSAIGILDRLAARSARIEPGPDADDT